RCGQGDELAATWQRDRILERARPGHQANSSAPACVKRTYVPDSPTQLDRARKGGAVLIGCAALLEKGTVD
ncbi:MAG: hypothetical protein WCA28_24830, partial [Bradyrhizobium sp.]